MSSRIFALGALGVLGTLSAVSAVGPTSVRLHFAAPGKATLHIAGARSPQQMLDPASSKFDGSLAEIARSVSTLRAGHEMEDLNALNPAVKFAQAASSSTPLVSIDAITTGDPQKLTAALVGLGLQHAAQYSNDVGGWLPIDQLGAASALAEVHAIRAAMSKTRTGAVTSQGDYAQNSDLVRTQNSLTGAGITVGVISDSYDCYQAYQDAGTPAAGGQQGYANNGFTATAATDISTGDLPANVLVLAEANFNNMGCMGYGAPVQLPLGDEGRAMMQIVHDVAPGAGLAFYTAENSEADFANGIVQLAAAVSSGGAGAKVIVDDVGYFDEPFFQDGLIAQAINSVEANGVAYFSSAGNNGTLAYNNNSPNFSTLSSSAPNSGEHLLNFDQTGAATATTSLPITIPSMSPGEFVVIVVQWDQPFITGAPSSGGSTSQIDVCITPTTTGQDIIANGNLQSATCSGASGLQHDPVQVMIIDNPANATTGDSQHNSQQQSFNIQVGLVSGTTPGRIKVVVEDDGLGTTINKFATNSGTIQGHPLAAGALAVGAAFFVSTPSCGFTPTLEGFSSAGGDPILFDSKGTRLTTPVTRQKPDLVGPDGGNDTFLGFTLASGNPPIPDPSTVPQCANNASFPNFFGTSAAAPHVASIAALLLQADPALTPTEIYTVLRQSAVAMSSSVTPAASPNYAAGFGFVQADVAATLIPAVVPAAPTLSLTSSSIATGSSTTITWSSANTTGCTASGSWSGALASTGSQTISPTTVGANTYTITCVNAAGNSPPTSVTLSVTAAAAPASGGGGGGGSLQLSALLALLGLCVARVGYGPRVSRRRI
jgi:hypothetical protein